MNKQFRGGIIYLVIVLVIMYFIMSITSFGKNSSSYGYSDFLNDFQSGNVTKVEIFQNAEHGALPAKQSRYSAILHS